MNALGNHLLLSLLIWLPVCSSIILLGFRGESRHQNARYLALMTTLISLALCGVMWHGFNVHSWHMQYTEQLTWLSSFGIHYGLGVDGISMPMVTLTCFTSVVVILGSWRMVHEKVSQYLAIFLLMQAMVVGVFCATDAMLFYIFWEAMLIPMYLSIGIWGGKNRSYASIKFFLFTFLGSLFMLVALLYLHYKTGSFNIAEFYQAHLTMREEFWLFLAFFLAFAVKMPMWPFHTWLPDAHTEAPAGGSVILAALMLKLGGYGFLRFSLPIVPHACHQFAWMMIILSLIAIVYIGLIAIAQTDMKKLIAYSSVAHMGFVTLGCFMAYLIFFHVDQGSVINADMSLEGAMVQMISHAFGAGAMFIGFGMLYQRMKTRDINAFGGIAKSMPIFTAFFMVFAMANVGLPGTSSFVGEFMILLASFHVSFWVTLMAASTLVISAVYTLWMFKRVFFGEVKTQEIAGLSDICGVELIVFILLAGMVFLIGLYPQPLLEVLHKTVAHILTLSMR